MFTSYSPHINRDKHNQITSEQIIVLSAYACIIIYYIIWCLVHLWYFMGDQITVIEHC
jgi:hypothetical protein